MNFIKRKNKGFTLIESILGGAIASVAALGFIKGITQYHEYVKEQSMAKDLTLLLKSVDTRISIDGYAYSFWNAGETVSGKAEIAPFILKTFVSKNHQGCGQADGWIPRLDSEANRAFVDCNFWQTKLPFDADIKIETIESDQGFLNNFNIYVDLPLKTVDEPIKDRFKIMHSILQTLEKNDFANRNGLNTYKLINKNTNEALTKINCSKLGKDCVLLASWNKQGFHESIKTDGTNSMISSGVSFKHNKLDHDRVKSCMLWEETSSNVWLSKEVECGIGMYSIQGTEEPVTIHLNIEKDESPTQKGSGATAVEKIVLDRLCNVYQRTSGNGITTNGSAPCGLLSNGTSVVQYLDRADATSMYLAENLYANAIENVDIVNVALNLYNNLSDSHATLADLKVNKEALLKETVSMLKSLNIGESGVTEGEQLLTADTLNSFGLLFTVRESSVINNMFVDDEGDSPDVKEVVEVLNSIIDNSMGFDAAAKYYISNQDAKVGDTCNDKSTFTIQKDTGVVLNCRNDWEDSSKLTWQSNYYGEIGVFQEECPSGWTEIEDIHSRFMIGSGKYSERFMPEVAYVSGDKGGLAYQRLDISQIPEHNHATPKFEHICDTCHRWVPKEQCPEPFTWFAYESRCVSSQGLSHTRDGSSVFTNDSERISTYVGGGKSHNNLPNYLAVNYCMYGKGDGLSPGITEPAPAEPEWVPYDSVVTGWMDNSDKGFYNCGADTREFSPEENLWYTLAECYLDQYKIEYEREQDLTTGNIRYTGVENREDRTVRETQIWKQLEDTYTEWEDYGEPFDCSREVKYYDSAKDDYYKKKTCSQTQIREKAIFEEDIRFGTERLIPNQYGENPTKEYQVIQKDFYRKVAGAGFDHVTPSDLKIIEGDYGETTELNLTIKLNKPFEEDVVYRVNTQDITTTSILSETENLIYDEYGNPFISVVDNQNGGRLMFDGGFPKYYNTLWNNANKFKDLQNQFIFMHNVISWMSETHSSRGKVLLYGDRNRSNDHYGVYWTSRYGFKNSIPGVIKIAGYQPVVKDYADYGGTIGGRKASISLDEMNKYASIVVMSSGGWESLDNETANNFSTYVNNGGGVYIITDHDWFQPTGNQILRKFGSEFYGKIDRTPSNSAYKLSTIWSKLSGTKYDRNHNLWRGMSSGDSIYAGGSEGNVRLFTPVQDYVGFSEDILFKAGETEKTITITINGDNLRENDETFKIILSNPDTGVIIGQSELIATIIDDDSAAKSAFTDCGEGTLVDGYCVRYEYEDLQEKNEVIEKDSTKEDGMIKLRYDDIGHMNVDVRISSYDFEDSCYKTNILSDMFEKNKVVTSETGNTRTELSVSSLVVTNEESWTSSKTFKDTYNKDGVECYGFKEGTDYNLTVEANLEKTIYDTSLYCKNGSETNGICEIKVTYEPNITCLGDYTKIGNECIKN